MPRRKKYFKTLREARQYIKAGYEQMRVDQPRRQELQVFQHRKQYFVGTPYEFESIRFNGFC